MNPRFLACINAWSVVVFAEKGNPWERILGINFILDICRGLRYL